MFDLNKHDGRSGKCYFSSTVLPTFVNHDQVPTKKKPFSTVLGQTSNYTLEILLPRDGANALQQILVDGAGTLQYAKVLMKLSDLIEGDFFNQYIKSGNILMLSEGRPGIDHIFSVSDGILRLEIDKATFERTGLDGKAIPNEGRKHVKARYAIELNLRLPSMVRGKKGFERTIWAFKNVLNQSVVWLLYDLKGSNDGSGPVAAHQPRMRTAEVLVERLDGVTIPSFPETVKENDYEQATELLEWLSLVTARSQRIHLDDKIDPYLSRYRVPLPDDDESQMGRDSPQDLTKFRWHGFLPSSFIQKILMATLKAAGESWFAFTATAFDGRTYTFLQDKHHTMTWEYQD